MAGYTPLVGMDSKALKQHINLLLIRYDALNRQLHNLSTIIGPGHERHNRAQDAQSLEVRRMIRDTEKELFITRSYYWTRWLTKQMEHEPIYADSPEARKAFIEQLALAMVKKIYKTTAPRELRSDTHIQVKGTTHVYRRAIDT